MSYCSWSYCFIQIDCVSSPPISFLADRSNELFFFFSVCLFSAYYHVLCLFRASHRTTSHHSVFCNSADVVIVLSEEEIQTNFQEISVVVVFFYFLHVRRRGLRSWFHFYFCRFFFNVNRLAFSFPSLSVIQYVRFEAIFSWIRTKCERWII